MAANLKTEFECVSLRDGYDGELRVKLLALNKFKTLC